MANAVKYSHIFLLYFQKVFEQRGRSFVWFLMAFLSPMIMLLFWKGSNPRITHISLINITSYYVLFGIFYSLLMTHVEDDVAVEDIQKGELVQKLLLPFSYYWLNFFQELPYRVLQGAFGVGVLFLFLLFHVEIFHISLSPIVLCMSALSAVLAYFISFGYKMLLGMTAFWLTEVGALFQFSEMLIFLLCGSILPLYLFPPLLAKVAYILPFGYMVYFPVIAIQGTLSFQDLLSGVAMQILWLVILTMGYIYAWKRGIKKFSGVGQ